MKNFLVILVCCFFSYGAWAQGVGPDSEKIDFAQSLLDHSQFQLAAHEFEEFIHQHPQSPYLAQAYLGAGDSYFFQQNINKAIDFYQRYQKSFPHGTKIWFNNLRLGQCFLLIGKVQEGQKILQQVDPKLTGELFAQTLYFYLGQSFLAQKNPGVAASYFQKALSTQPTGGYAPQIYLALGNVYALQGDYLKAMDQFKKSLDIAASNEVKMQLLTNAQWFWALLKSQQLDELMQYYNQKAKGNFQDPQFFQLHMYAAQALLKQNKNKEALDILDKLLDRETVAVNKDDAFLRLSALYLKGQAQEALKDNTAANISYTEASKEFPTDPNSYCRMAHLSFDKADYKEAATYFMDCFKRSPQAPDRDEILYNAFLMFQKAGMQHDMIEAATSYAQQFPSGPWIVPVTFQIAYHQQLQAKEKEALGLYEQLASQKISDALRFLVLKNSAPIYLKNNDPDKVAQALGWVVDHPLATKRLSLNDYLWLAEYWQGKKDPQQMLHILSQAQEALGPKAQDQGIHFFTAEALYMQHHYTQALDLYNQILAEAQDNPYKARAQLGRGWCFWSLGKKIHAKKAFLQAIALKPEDNYVTLHARFALAQILESQHAYQEAAKLYMMVGLLYKDSVYGPRALLKAGGVLRKLNDKQGAKKAFGQLLEDYPQSQEALKAKVYE